MTPWGEKLMKPGTIIFRSHKYIHAFRAPDDFKGESWTLFIVGRRKHRQNSFEVTKK